MKNKNILHYTVGLNSNRGGGLTKYVDDLADYQSHDNNVYILYPGEYKLFNNNITIKCEKAIKNIKIFSIVNPLSLPMMFGTTDVNYIKKKSDINIWKIFLKKYNINIIHIHTLMGLYSEFVIAASELNIPIIYTTHDYFGLCSKQTLIYNGKICTNWKSCKNCPKCNSLAFNKYKTFLIHSKMFSFIRKLKIFKIFKTKEKSKIDTIDNNSNIKMNSDFYIELRKKMLDTFSLIDYFHFNSSISKNVFEKFIPNINGEIINIMHKDILDNRVIKNFENRNLRITFLGPTAEFKGFNDIIKAIDKIYDDNKNIELNLYSYTDTQRDYIRNKGNGYKYSELKNIFENSDILVVPSKWYETFGFVAEEALSYGVPVIVSSVVGAKDLIKNGINGFIVNDFNELAEIFKLVINNREILKKLNNNIYTSNFYSFENHCDEMYDLYKRVINRKKEEQNL